MTGDDPLDAVLEERAAHVDDAGFTRGVLARLPPARRARRVRTPLLLCAALLSCATALHWASRLQGAQPTAGLTWMGMVAAGVALAATIGWASWAAVAED